MSKVAFSQLLASRWATAKSLLCVGLDPDPARFPSTLKNDRSSIARFCIDIVDATADVVCAFKPQIAYFAAVGAETQLESVCEHIRSNHPTSQSSSTQSVVTSETPLPCTHVRLSIDTARMQ